MTDEERVVKALSRLTTWQLAPVPARYGWVCPKCGRVYAPFVAMCAQCPALLTIFSGWGTSPSQISHPKTDAANIV